MRFWSLGGKRVLALVTRTLGFFHLSCKRNWYSFLRIHKETEAPFRGQHGEAVRRRPPLWKVVSSLLLY